MRDGENGAGLDLHLNVVKEIGARGRSLEESLRDAVRSGRLAAGTRLPGSRSLAADLGLARGTVVQAYNQLAAEGWLIGAPGSGTLVADVRTGAAESVALPDRAPRATVDFRAGRPEMSAFPRSAWVASLRRVLATAPAEILDYPPEAGLRELRTVIADYVARARGVRADPESVVITSGYGQALALLARTWHKRGVRAVAMENPGLARHRWLVRAGGQAVTPLTVDENGADPGSLSGDVRAAVLTPAHQYPLGGVLAPERRAAFLAWARENDGYLLEDDYDGEFRYDQQPVGAMQALGPDRVIYAGSASKALAPGVRIGWLVVPNRLREVVLETLAETGGAVPVLDQLTLAELITHGDYDRHIRRARLTYRRRREELAALVSTPLGGISAGLHALLPVDSAARERELVDAATRAGVNFYGLHSAGYWHEPGENQLAALLIGYARPPANAWRHSLEKLAEVLGTHGDRTNRP